MASDLVVSGPFEIPFTLSNANIKRIDTPQAKQFWEKAETAPFHLKRGVYIFATRAGKGFRPIYVGKATKGFKKECFTYHKLHHYGQMLCDGARGKPVMFFIAPPGRTTRVPANIIKEIEDLMIQFAVSKNPSLRNKMGTKLANWTIKGVIRGGKGKRSKTADSFTTMMGIPRRIAG
jgi:hypothetical protein